MFFAVSSLLLLLPLLGVVNAATPSFNCNAIWGKLRQIDAGAGKVHGVDSNGDNFSWENNNWKYIPGKLTHVSTGPAGVWGVDKDRQVFRLLNNVWHNVSGSMKQIDAGGNKFVAGVNSQDNVYCSIQKSADTPVDWKSMNGSQKYNSCGKWGCWGVNRDDSVYFRHGVTSEFCQGTGWQLIDGKLIMIETGTDGSVYGVNSAGNAYRRNGINAMNPTGTSWTQLDLGYNSKHLTYADRYLWLITPTDDIIRCAVTK
ncbi:fish-egg lectin-like [Rana temporaria]|uniref:fish-egg lectin-like n=1 Tax=Rana temporaria TaxID=8407 RepID=UPI001AAD9269|nr:fish-egg lectin-like [Rana temporaria]